MVSEKKIKELENSAVELSLTVDAESVRASYEEVVKKYAKQAQVKGFRKGKVPKRVLEDKYGEVLKEESMVNLMDSALKEALDQMEEEHRPLPYSQPTLVNEDQLSFELDKDFTFSVTYDVYPKVKLSSYSGYEVEIPDVSVSDEDINEELKTMQEQNALVTETDEPAQEQSIVTVTYWELDDEGNEVEGTRREDFTFTIGTGYNYYEFDHEIIGMKAGESKTIEKSFPEDSQKEELAGKTVKLRVEVSAVKKRDIPELDDEFAQDISESYETLEDLKNDIRRKKQEELDNRMKDYQFSKVVDRIIEDNPFSVPESMVNAQLEDSWQNYLSRMQMPEDQLLKFMEMQGMSKENILENWRESALQSLKYSVVVQAVAREESVEVSDEEADEALKKELEAMEGGQELDENVRSYYREMQKGQLKKHKAADLLLEKNQGKPGKKMSLKEFLQWPDETKSEE